MSLILYGHPLSSYTQKVLIALYETGAPFSFRRIDLGKDEDRALMARIEPMGRMPGLRDEAREVTLSQSSVMIEYIDRHYPGPDRLIPEDFDASILTRQWDRFFDFQIMQMAQPMVDARLFMDKGAEAPVTAFAKSKLDLAYAALDKHLRNRKWAAGEAFTLADCAAAPALFYAGFIHPFDAHPDLSAYFEKLVARPSFARARIEALPWLNWFPYYDLVPARFR
jgi:glutathione S-transferase